LKTRTKVFLLINTFAFLLILFVLPDFADMGDFHSNLWGTAKLLVSHRSPYDIKQLMPTRGALWFPQIISVGFFLGFLEQSLAERVWVCINFLSYSYILFSYFNEKPSPIKLGLVLIVTLLFPPLSTYVLYGQCALVFLAALLKSRDVESFFSPFFLLVGLSKPQIGFIFAIWLFFQIWKKGKAFMLKYVLRTILWFVIIMTPIFTFYPRWISDFIYNYQNNNQWDQPALISLLSKNFGQIGFVIWLIILLLAILCVLFLFNKLTPEMIVPSIFGVTAIVAPYIWSWDFVLLFPLMIYSILNSKGIKVIFVSVSLLVVDVIFWMIRLSGPVNDFRNWPIPMLVFGLLTIIYFVKIPETYLIKLQPE
jgi:hypothetical protein